MSVLTKKSRIEEIEVTCATEDGALLKFSDFTYADDDGVNDPGVWVDISYPPGNRHRTDKATVSFKLTRVDARKLFEELKPWLDK